MGLTWWPSNRPSRLALPVIPFLPPVCTVRGARRGGEGHLLLHAGGLSSFLTPLLEMPRAPGPPRSLPLPHSPPLSRSLMHTRTRRRHRLLLLRPPATPCAKSHPRSSASPRFFASSTQGTPGGRQHRQDRHLRRLLPHLAVVDSRAPVRPRAN